MGRDRRTQAVLPLRGKILNIERARLDKMLASEQIKNLVFAFGTAIGDTFDITNLRYHKIILATDGHGGNTDANAGGAGVRVWDWVPRIAQPFKAGLALAANRKSRPGRKNPSAAPAGTRAGCRSQSTAEAVGNYQESPAGVTRDHWWLALPVTGKSSRQSSGAFRGARVEVRVRWGHWLAAPACNEPSRRAGCR